GDYRFLERFLDVTKANLFFAHGVLIVEGDAEAILLPVLARLIGRDLTEHGVSIVNVGGTGLRRFSRIFQRYNDDTPKIDIPVACLADMDVMPDCAPKILGLVKDDDDQKWNNSARRWKVVRDFGDNNETRNKALVVQRQRLKQNDGQSVQTFVADHWTLEYDLAHSGLAEQVFTAAVLAKNDDPLNAEKKKREDVLVDATEEFERLKSNAGDGDDVLCSQIYRLFHSRAASKAIAAQYLAELLLDHCKTKEIDAAAFRKLLPVYLVDAIEYLTPQPAQEAPTPATDGGDHG
ncbi:MAG: ATP-dependent endonuclease, partial [Planctomycetota bacterium]|nr:ATP-dependent endonuclease [Planctomycetota bacterium]